jgi:predicted dehydrogenase
MKAGKAVLCEKAFAITAREAEEMIRVAREQKVFLMEAMVTRHYPVIHTVCEWVKEGRIGEVRMVKATRCARGKFNDTTRHLNPALGGGSLLDVGVYVISFASMIYGKPPLKAVGYGHIGTSGSDEQGAALLEYENGALGILTFALRTDAVNEAYILGTKGRIKIYATFAVPDKATLTVDGQDEVTIELPVKGRGFHYEAAEVMKCLREGKLESPRMPLDESLEIMRTMDTIRAEWSLKYPNDLS